MHKNERHARFREPVRAPPTAFRSKTWIEMLSRAHLYARHRDVPILLVGESGTGKTMLARDIHEHSPRASAPFQHLMLSGIDDSLASTDLFGYVPGAFTGAHGHRAGAFAAANGGTLFLDEIGKASAQIQMKLLHAVEAHVIRQTGSDRDVRLDLRIVAATTVPLSTRVAENQFLDDLCARLDAFVIVLPPLRDRPEDIPILVREIMARRAPDCGYAHPPAVDHELMSLLQRAPWHRNVRGLDMFLWKLLIDARGADPLSPEHCRDDFGQLRPTLRRNGPLTAGEAARAINDAAGNKSAAARQLGVDRATLHRTLVREQQRLEREH